MPYKAGKTFTHSSGLSVCFRQWKADSHCNLLHGYALQIEFEFERYDHALDDRGWVMGFGDLKPVKQWLERMFDHKTLIAADDPELDTFRILDKRKIIRLVIVDKVGMEAFCKMTFKFVREWLADNYPAVALNKVTIREHDANWASYSK